MIKTCKLKFKICSHMYPCDGCHDVNMVCVLFLGDARDAYRGLPGLSRLSRVDHWMITRFSREVIWAVPYTSNIVSILIAHILCTMQSLSNLSGLRMVKLKDCVRSGSLLAYFPWQQEGQVVFLCCIINGKSSRLLQIRFNKLIAWRLLGVKENFRSPCVWCVY
jgi:hypothetical protein